MKTPYCPAIGVQRREVDQLRISISEEVHRLSEVERRRTTIDLEMQRERTVAAASLDAPSTAYFMVMRSEHTRLEEAERAIDARVAQLRSQARDAYGSLSAVEGAAGRYRTERLRHIESAEQAASDDRSAAAFVSRHNAARSAAARRRA
jgi:hypothetical protein